MKTVSFFSVFATVMIFSAAAFAGEYDVHIPATSNSCATEAANLSARFAQATGVTPTSSVCLGTVSYTPDSAAVNLYSLRLTYDPTANVPAFYSAVFGNNPEENQLGTITGAYDTYANCVGDLQNQSAAFATATGLQPLAAYCAPGRDSWLAHNFVLHVDSYGKPASTLQVFYVTMVDVGAVVLAQAQNILTASGAVIAKATSNAVYYYASSNLPLAYDELVVFSDSASCQAQIGEAQNLMKAMTAGPSYVACTQQGVSYVLQSLRVGDVMISRDESVSGNRYYSLAECLADTDHLKSVAFSSRWKSQSVFCRPDDTSDGGFEAEILGLYY